MTVSERIICPPIRKPLISKTMAHHPDLATLCRSPRSGNLVAPDRVSQTPVRNRIPFAVLQFVLAMQTAACAQSAGVQTTVFSEIVGRSSQNYLIYLPQDYEQQTSVPLLLFLHGAGERGDRQMDLLAVHGPPKLIASGKHFPFIVVAPQCKKDAWWAPAELSDLLDDIENRYKVDKARIYVTGLSMGGFGTWALAMYDPDRFAAIAPICGGGNAIAVRYTAPIRAAVWTFHGAKDTVVPLSASAEMVAAMRARNVNVRFTVYPKAGHNSWTETYGNEHLYEWLLSHRLEAH